MQLAIYGEATTMKFSNALRLSATGFAFILFSTSCLALSDDESEKMAFWAYAKICKISLTPSQEGIALSTFESVANRVKNNATSKIKSTPALKELYMDNVNEGVMKAGGCSQMYSSRSPEAVYGQ
jgi:hypothetical protein